MEVSLTPRKRRMIGYARKKPKTAAMTDNDSTGTFSEKTKFPEMLSTIATEYGRKIAGRIAY